MTAAAGSRALVVSAGGDWLDPWHPFSDTSGAIVRELARAGLEVTARDDVEPALVSLGAEPAAVVVVNLGRGPGDGPGIEARLGLLAHLGRGGALLVIHSSSTSFEAWADWERVVGGRWVRGTTFHPEQGDAVVTPTDDPIVAGLPEIRVFDECYSSLRVDPGVRVLATHSANGAPEPIAWARLEGEARVVYDALGHDVRSYESETRLALLRRELDWLLRRD